MEGIRSAGLIICILMVLMAYLKQAIPRGKTTYLMKAIVSVYILLCVVNAVRGISWKGLEDLFNRSYVHSEEVFEKTADLMEDGLKKEFQQYLESVELSAVVLSVEVSGELDSFRISGVFLTGEDAESAKNLLAGRYEIGLNLVEVVYD